MPTTQPHGSWPSPIDAALAASHDGRPEYVGAVGDELWWTAPRPAEAGRRALVRHTADGTTTELPAPGTSAAASSSTADSPGPAPSGRRAVR